MKKLVAFALGIGLSVSAVQAMPFALDQAPSAVIKVAGGCGAGFHRGPNGGCRPNGGPAVVVAPGAVVVAPGGRCGGRGQHRVCNGHGRCWMACN